MKITLLELRNIIRETISECYGLPVEKEIPLYNIRPNIGKPSKADPENSPLRKRPTGISKNKKMFKESFSRITPREMEQWKQGNWGFLQEDTTNEMCEACGGQMIEGNCGECSGNM